MEPKYKYEIAFSFCQEDEQLAFEIADLLPDSVSTFIYSQEQKELAGKDGEIEFRKIFIEKSRVVVVLYREKYGTTNWTRIEEEAIRDRALDNGYDFTLFIPLDKKTPKYLPKTRIWFNLERFGIKGAATVISYKVTEQDGESIELSVKDKAEKLKRKLEFKRKVETYRQSHEAIGDALKEVDKLFELAEENINVIFSGMNIGFVKEIRDFFRLRFENIAFEAVWSRTYNNSLDNSLLKINFWSYTSESTKPYLKISYEYVFGKNLNWENVWKLSDNENEYCKSEILIEKHLKKFMEIIEKESFGDDDNVNQLFFI